MNSAHLARKFDAMFDRWIRFQGFALDLVQQIRSSAKEFVVGEFPSLRVCRGTLCSWCLGVHHDEDSETGGKTMQRTRLILWKPYMFNWRTKLENWDDISTGSEEQANALTLLCLKWEPRMLRLNSPTLETTKDVPSSVHEMKCEDFGSLIILIKRSHVSVGPMRER